MPTTTDGSRHINPPITPLLRGVTWLEVLVLFIAGAGLLLNVALVVGIWPWPLRPFNQRFLGAIYSAALVAAFWQAIVGRWAPSRAVTWMIFVFTAVVTVLSFVHIGSFDFQRVEVWIWFVLYIGVCVNAGLHLVWPRQVPRVVGTAPSAGWRRVLLAQAVLYGAIGLAHLLMPAWLGLRWPWPVDGFHAQLYRGAFLPPAGGALCLRRATTPMDWWTQGTTQLAWGLLPIVGLVLADASVASAKRVDWTGATTCLWLAVYAGLACVGAAMVLQARRSSGPALTA